MGKMGHFSRYFWAAWYLIKQILIINNPIVSFPVINGIILFPVLNGIIEGVFFANLTREAGLNSLSFFMQDVKYSSVPRGPSMFDGPLPPDHVYEILGPINWWTELGLKRLDIDNEIYPVVGVAHQDDLADLQGLYRKVRYFDKNVSWHHWIYASQSLLQIEDSFIDEWDEAFIELLQDRYVDPRAAKFHFISCPGRFLCNAWGIKGPTLLHFTTDVLDTEVDYEGIGPRENMTGYKKVIVRAINLPVRVGLPNVFPSPFNQLRDITGNASLWTGYPPHSPGFIALSRLDEVTENYPRKHPFTYGFLIKAEDFFLWLLCLEDSVVLSTLRLLAIVLTNMAVMKGFQVWDAFFPSTELCNFCRQWRRWGGWNRG